MWEKIFNLAISNGIWAVLFLALLIFQLNDSKKREVKYQETIEHLGTSLEVIKDVKDDVKEIKDKLENMGVSKPKKNEVKSDEKEQV